MKNDTTDCNVIDAPEHNYLHISVSQLPDSGNGLYTTIDIYREEIIAVFRGERLTDLQAELRAKRKKDQYFIQMPDGSIMDSMKTKCFAKYANDTKGSTDSGFRNNSKITMDEDDNICLIATRNIRSGEEIFCGYGKNYWKRHSIA